MLTSITDSLVPPATDREIEAIVAIAYPGEQNSRVEARLAETLATHPSLSRFLQQASPTFVPRSADTALVISVALVGQGVMDVPDGAEGLNTWVESAFRPDPTDRLAWRQRDGYRDPIDFIDEDARAELLQRLLAAAWNGELTAERIPSNGQTGELRHPDRAVRGAGRAGAAHQPRQHAVREPPRAARRRVPARDLAALRLGHRVGLGDPARALAHGAVGLRGAAPADERRAGRSAAVHRLRPRARSHGPRRAERAELRHLRDELRRSPTEQSKRIHQVDEYVAFWERALPNALTLSFGTLGYGSFAEVIAGDPDDAARAGCRPAALGDDAESPYPTGVFDDRRPG